MADIKTEVYREEWVEKKKHDSILEYLSDWVGEEIIEAYKIVNERREVEEDEEKKVIRIKKGPFFEPLDRLELKYLSSYDIPILLKETESGLKYHVTYHRHGWEGMNTDYYYTIGKLSRGNEKSFNSDVELSYIQEEECDSSGPKDEFETEKTVRIEAREPSPKQTFAEQDIRECKLFEKLYDRIHPEGKSLFEQINFARHNKELFEEEFEHSEIDMWELSSN